MVWNIMTQHTEVTFNSLYHIFYVTQKKKKKSNSGMMDSLDKFFRHIPDQPSAPHYVSRRAAQTLWLISPCTQIGTMAAVKERSLLTNAVVYQDSCEDCL